jgi:hypothetical protein
MISQLLIAQRKTICNVYFKPILTFSLEISVNETRIRVMAMNSLRNTEGERRMGKKLGMIFF